MNEHQLSMALILITRISKLDYFKKNSRVVIEFICGMELCGGNAKIVGIELDP